MNVFLEIILILAAFAGGVILGMYLLRRQVEKEFAENPRLNVEAVRTLLSASGQRPNEGILLSIHTWCGRSLFDQIHPNQKGRIHHSRRH